MSRVPQAARADASAARAPADAWTALVRCAIGALGLTLLAVGHLVPTPEAFPALRAYAFVIGALLVLVGASARHAPFLALLGFIALAAGLAASIVGNGQPAASRAALALDSGAAILLGAVGRRPWMAIPFLLVPLLIVAAGPPGWGPEQEEFADAWHAAMGCECLWPGVPAALAVVGAAIGDATARPWRTVKPSGFGPFVLAVGTMGAALVLVSVTPVAWETARLVLARMALVAGILAWMAVAYQAGRVSFVAQAGIVGLLVLVGQLYADDAIRYPESYNLTLLATVLASLVPALLAALGLLVRSWIGTEGPDPDSKDLRPFFQEARTGEHVETRQPLHVGGFGARDRPDEAVGGSSWGGGAGKGDE